jgi:hypothetical protein
MNGARFLHQKSSGVQDVLTSRVYPLDRLTKTIMPMKPCYLFIVFVFTAWVSAKTPVDFNRDIRPILSANCFSCHGPDEESRKGKLRLDTAEGAKKALGTVEESELIYRLDADDPEELMPPPDSSHQLTAEQKTLLREWVAAGAQYDLHWAFQAPTKAAVPTGTNPIDHFVSERLKAAGLTIAESADRYALIRRLSLDLTGLPPTIEEANAFAKSGNLEVAVDRLLASEAFGEHWARMWLDLARYADTKGYEKDKPRTIWRYRDWVIRALNQDMPFDQFTTEQLAGDLLSEPRYLPTAFHRNTMENDEGGTDDEEFRVAAVKDRVDTTVQVWMGLTMGCAKCHSHKYDPITQEDYYRFYAFFNQTEDADRGAPVMPTPTVEQATEIAQLEAEIEALEKQKRPAGFAEDFAKWQASFESTPLWQPLKLAWLDSKKGVELTQATDGTLSVKAENPDTDTWTLTLDLPTDKPVTSLRIDALKKAAGGKWKDKNVALRELTAKSLWNGEVRKLKLVKPRADFSQRNWEVARAIDGKTKSGWAFSPKADQPHVAIFDFDKPLRGGQLLLTLEQEYGQGLIFEQFRLSVSTHPSNWLKPDVDPTAGLERVFAEQTYPATRDVHGKLTSSRKRLSDLQASVIKTPIMRELRKDKQRQTRIHTRGNFLDKGDAVEARVPSTFGELPDDALADRLGVAKWLMQPENPLTARVMVNRVWARLFGVGIVETEEDFGSQGTVPSHPELLDWLAVDYRETGWSLKGLLKTIAMSATYRQGAAVTPESLAADPRNRLLSRGPRFRLSAEMVRDQALAASGLLTRKLGGPSVMPPQPAGVWKSTYSGAKWRDATGPDRYRRGLYTFLKRTSPHPAMLTFDAGSGEVCQIRRVRTNTPLQALVTLNDPAFVEAAGALSKRMKSLEHGFRLVLIRPPSQTELKRLADLHATLAGDFAKDPEAAQALLKSAGLTEGDAAMVAVANVLLNLDEVVMKP